MSDWGETDTDVQGRGVPGEPQPEDAARDENTSGGGPSRGLRRLFWPAVSAFLIGVIISITARLGTKKEVEVPPKDHVVLGDKNLRGGDYQSALSDYAEAMVTYNLLVDEAAEVPASLRRRIVICQEWLKADEQLRAGYYQAAQTTYHLLANRRKLVDGASEVPESLKHCVALCESGLKGDKHLGDGDYQAALADYEAANDTYGSLWGKTTSLRWGKAAKIPVSLQYRIAICGLSPDRQDDEPLNADEYRDSLVNYHLLADAATVIRVSLPYRTAIGQEGLDRLADEQLREGDYQGCLATCRLLLDAATTDPVSLQNRIALCRKGIKGDEQSHSGDFQGALTTYHLLLDDMDEEPLALQYRIAVCREGLNRQCDEQLRAGEYTAALANAQAARDIYQAMVDDEAKVLPSFEYRIALCEIGVKGDQRLHEGDYQAALAAYPLLVDDEAKVPPSYQYRRALCLEGLGRWDESLGAYREIAAGSNLLAAAGAQVGQARVWTRMWTERRVTADAEASRAEEEASLAEAEVLLAEEAAPRVEARASRAEREASAADAIALPVEANASRAEEEASKAELEAPRDEAMASRARADALQADAGGLRAQVELHKAEAKQLRTEAEQWRVGAEAWRSKAKAWRTEAEVIRAQAKALLTQAKSLLCHLVLRPAQPELRNQRVMGDAQYLLGLVLALEGFESVRPEALDDTATARPPVDWLPENALDLILPIDNEPPAAPGTEGPTNGITVAGLGQEVAIDEGIRVTNTSFSHALATVSVQGEDAIALIDRLVGASGHGSPSWTEQARQRVAGRTATVMTENMPLAVLLAGLTERFGLIWEIKDETLRISSVTECEGGVAELADHRLRMAYNVLKYASLESPSHRWNSRAQIELGNLQVRDEKPIAALRHYRQAHDGSSSLLNIAASYDLALALRQHGDWEGARRSLLFVADGVPGHKLSPLAFCQIGRTHLEEGEPQKAIAPLRHAVSANIDPNSRAVAVVYLALAHLLTDELRETGVSILRYRDAFEHPARPRYRNAAAFLNSYARYQLLTRGDKRWEEALFLVRSLMALGQDYQWLGAPGALVVGRAYRDLGLTDKMANVYRKALEGTPSSPLSREIRYVLADYSYSSGDRSEAIKRLASLAGTGSGRWASLARLRLAENALEEERPQDCVTECLKLLRQPSSDISNDVLRLMGRAHEQAGDYEQAVLCYDGKTDMLLARPQRQQ